MKTMNTIESKLTSSRVHETFMNCLFRDNEDTSTAVIAEGIMGKFGFNPDRLKAAEPDIREMLAELPDEFHADKGGGWSFLNACMDRHDNHWAEHPTINELLVLGIAVQRAKILMPREMWSMFPGGLPYFSVILN